MANATYNPTTPMDTTAKNATGTGAPLMSTSTSAGRVITAATTAANSTPLAGTLDAVSLDHNAAPGTAPSRLNANSIREQLVRQATVQKNWPEAEISSTKPAQPDGSAWLKMDATAPPAADTPSESCTANRKDSNRIQPPMAE